MHITIYLRSFIAIIIFTSSTAIQARSPTSDADINLLPPYCKAKYGRTTQADAENWIKRFGRRNWLHMHHYCSGLNKINKARMSFDKAERKNILQSAIKSFDYVQIRWPPEFVLQPEVCLKKGNALMDLDQAGPAIKQYYQAINLNSKYTPAYAALGNYYSSHGEQEKAEQILELGLEKNPNSKSLKRRLGELQSSP